MFLAGGQGIDGGVVRQHEAPLAVGAHLEATIVTALVARHEGQARVVRIARRQGAGHRGQIPLGGRAAVGGDDRQIVGAGDGDGDRGGRAIAQADGELLGVLVAGGQGIDGGVVRQHEAPLAVGAHLEATIVTALVARHEGQARVVRIARRQGAGHRGQIPLGGRAAVGGDDRQIVGAGDGDGDRGGRAIHRLHDETLDLGLPLTQILHLAVVDVVSPGTVLGDGQAAQCTSTGHAIANHELGLIRTVHIGHAQSAGLGQGRVARILGHSAAVSATNNGGIVNRRDGACHLCGGIVQAVGDRVFEGDTTVEIWRGREYQLAIAEGHSAIVDGNRATFGNGLTVDGIDGQTIAIGIGIVAGHIDGDGAVFLHAELIILGQGRGVHHAAVRAIGRGIARRISQGCIDRDGTIVRQIRRGNGQIDLSLVDIVGSQNGSAVRYPISIPVHIKTITDFCIGRQADDDIDPTLPLVGGDDVVRAILDLHQRRRRRRAVHAAIIGGGAGIAGRIGHAGGHVIAAVRQGCLHIHAEAAIQIDSGDQGLLVAVGIGHHQGHCAAGSGIRGPGEGRGAVVDVVRRGHSDGGCGEIEELILVILRFGQRSGIIRIGGIKAGGGDGGITGSVDGDEAAVAAGASNAAYVARSGCPARRRRFKCLGRVCPRQNRLLQGGDVVRYITLRQLGIFRLGSVARAQGKGGLPPPGSWPPQERAILHPWAAHRLQKEASGSRQRQPGRLCLAIG